MAAVACQPNEVAQKKLPRKLNSPKLSPLTLTRAKSHEKLCQGFRVRPDSLQRVFHWDDRVKLGAGAFADVYRATCAVAIDSTVEPLWGTGQLQPGQDYAVKILPRELLNASNKHHKNLAHEVAILHLIDHPNCIKLHDVFEDSADDSVVLCLELMEGGELLEMLQDHVKQGGHLSEVEARKVITQVLNALTYLHGRQIVHRDIKPENIIINPKTLQIKLVDFGFAKSFGHQALSSMEDLALASPVLMTPLGTLRYMPPEILHAIGHSRDRLPRARDEVQKVDMFAVGVTAYMMLGGTHPFTCRSYNDLPELIEEGPSFQGDNFASISSRAKDFCFRLMNYQAALRPSAKEALLHPWFKLPIAAPPACSIRIQETRSAPALMDWLREQSCLDSDPPATLSPTSWSKAGQRAPAAQPPSPKKSTAIPFGSGGQKPLLGVSPGEAWFDMSCEFDAFCHLPGGPDRLPTPLMLSPAAPAFSGSPPSQGTSSTENWADMSFDEDSFWATAGTGR